MPVTTQIDIPERQIESLANLFKALSDPARLRILNLIAHGGELCNGNIEVILNYGNSKISRHFAFLKQAGLIQDRREGVWIYYSLPPVEDKVIQQVHTLLDMFPELYPIFREDLERMKSCKCSSG